MKKIIIKFKELISLVMGNIGAQIINIIMIPIIARIFSPEDLGQLTLFISILAIINVFATLKLELALPLESDNIKLANLLVGCMIILIIVVTLTCFAIFGLINIEILETQLYYLLPLMLFGEGIYNLSIYFSIRFENYKGIAISKLSKSIITNSSQITFGLINSISIALIIGDVCGRLFGANRLIKNIFTFTKTNKKEIKLKRIFEVIKVYKNFPLYSTWSAFFNSSSLQLFPIFIGMFFGNYYLGIYAMSQRILSAPLGLVTQAIGQFFLGNITKLVRSNEIETLKNIFYKYTLFLLIFNIIVVMIFLIFSDFLINFFLGNEWSEVAEVLKLIFLMVIIQYTVSPLSQILNVMQLQKVQMAWDITRFSAVILGLLCIHNFNIVFSQAIVIYSTVIIVAYFVLFFIIKNVLKKERKNEY